MPDTRVFRALHFPHLRREVVSAVDATPINVQPGEILYDEAANKLYAGLEDTTAVQVGGGGAGSNNYVESDIAGITGAATVTNIVSMTQAAYDALASKDESTLYIING
jgi:phage-related minor tail protein